MSQHRRIRISVFLCVYMHRTRRADSHTGLDFLLMRQKTWKLKWCCFWKKTFMFMTLQIIMYLTKLKYKFVDSEATQAPLHQGHVGVQGPILYQCTDLTEIQPDAHKYIPLFLPLCGCQLGREVGLFWVFSVYSSQSHAFTFLIRELCWLPEMHMYSYLWSSVMVVICWKLHNSSPVSA